MCTGNVQLVVLCISLGDIESIQSTRLHFPLSLSLTYSIYSCTVAGGVTLDGAEMCRGLVGQAVWLHLAILTFCNVTAS